MNRLKRIHHRTNQELHSVIPPLFPGLTQLLQQSRHKANTHAEIGLKMGFFLGQQWPLKSVLPNVSLWLRHCYFTIKFYISISCDQGNTFSSLSDIPCALSPSCQQFPVVDGCELVRGSHSPQSLARKCVHNGQTITNLNDWHIIMKSLDGDLHVFTLVRLH